VVARDSSESQISELSMASPAQMTPAPTVTRQSEFQERFSMNIGNYETKQDVLSALLPENINMTGPLLLDSPTVVTRDAPSVERDDEFLSACSPSAFGTPTVAPSEQGENVLLSATSPSDLDSYNAPNVGNSYGTPSCTPIMLLMLVTPMELLAVLLPGLPQCS